MKRSASVAITIRSFDLSGPAIEKLKEHCTISFINKTGTRLSEMDLMNALGNAEGVIAGTETFSRRIIDQCSSLKVISRVGVGTDSIDLVSCTRPWDSDSNYSQFAGTIGCRTYRCAHSLSIEIHSPIQ